MLTQASQTRINRFQDIKFGMFIHWGLYSLLGRGEWVMHWEKIPVPEYERLVPQFNPRDFNADQWVQLAADAGQKYMVITSRHHDGFSMYDTALSEYKITNTPFKRDPLAELAQACARSGEVKLGFYVSLLDWHHPAYRFRAQSGLAWDDYLAFLHGQVAELCTHYGDLACLWFDGDWPGHHINQDNAYFEAGGPFEYEQLYGLIREKQPEAVIHNNRHAKPLPGEDVQGFEQDLPGENSAGFNTTQIYGLPVEVCMTINDNWGIHFKDHNHKTTRHLIRNLVKSAGMGGNYLLNVGPTAEGTILPEQARRLREMGVWLKLNGDSIYKTRAGLIPAQGHCTSTYRSGSPPSGAGETHFIHVLEDISDCLKLQGVPETVTTARLVRDGSPLEFERRGEAVLLTIPPQLRDPLVTAVALT